MTGAQLEPSYADLAAHVLGTDEIHAVFTTLLRTLSRPGTTGILSAGSSGDVDPVVLPLLALVGHLTPFAVVGDDGMAAAVLARVTGGQEVAIADASYVAFLRQPTAAEIADLRRGTAAAPETAAQIVVGTAPLPGEDARPAGLTVSGPGVDGSVAVRVPHLGTAIADWLGALPREFPCGFDTWLVDRDGYVTAVPRSSSVTIARTDQNGDS